MRPLPVSPSHDSRIGAKLRAFRTARGLTLDQLAIATGLTKGFLSRVERDETSPSIASLVAICDVMSVEVGSLFVAPDVGLVRGADAPMINLGGTGVVEHLLTPRRQERIQLLDSVVAPGGSGGSDLYTINCELEVLFVIEGSVQVRFSDRTVQIDAGDCLTLAGSEPHTWANASADNAARMIWVLTPAPWSGSN